MTGAVKQKGHSKGEGGERQADLPGSMSLCTQASNPAAGLGKAVVPLVSCEEKFHFCHGNIAQRAVVGYCLEKTTV